MAKHDCIASGDASTIPPTGVQLTPEQVKRIAGLFTEIADLAWRTDRHFYFAHTDGLEESDELRLDSCRRLAAHMGWLADLGCALTGGTSQLKGDPEQWMRPPAYLPGEGVQ